MNFNFLIPIVFFALVAFIVYITSTHNYKIKKEILERGGTVDMKPKRFILLDIGLCIIGLALGLALAVIPQSADMAEEAKGLLTASLILLWSGLGLVTSYLMKKNIERQK